MNKQIRTKTPDLSGWLPTGGLYVPSVGPLDALTKKRQTGVMAITKGIYFLLFYEM